MKSGKCLRACGEEVTLASDWDSGQQTGPLMFLKHQMAELFGSPHTKTLIWVH